MDQFMLPPIARAKLSAEALSLSIKIPASQSHEFIAQTLGYETWSHFVSRATLSQPDKMDAELSPDIAHHRLAVFADRLTQVLQIDSHAIDQLAKSINPYANTEPKPYRIEAKDAFEDGDLNFHDMFEAVGGEDGMLQFIHQLANEHPELSRFKEFDTYDQVQESLRLSAPIEPSLFYDALANLTDWEMEESSFEYDYEFLAPSFYLVSAFDHAEYPVFLISLVATPGDTQDKAFEKIKSDIGKHKSRALVLFKTGIFKEIDGVTYFVIGTFFDSKNWTWTLLTDLDPEQQSKTILPQNYDLESPPLVKELEVGKSQGIPRNIVYHAFVTGQINTENGSLTLSEENMTIQGVGGWTQMV
jgi:hypothetical protein